jgi:hypothetical protein
LRGALSVAEDGDIISVPPGTYTLTTGRTLTISVDAEILGEGIGETVIQAATHPSVAEVGVFTIEAGATVIFRDVEIRNGNSSLNGGGINTTGTVTVKDSWIHDNWAQSAGGGIWSRGGFFGEGVLTIINSQIEFNRAANAGGGVYTEGTGNITRSFITDNAATNTTEEVVGGGGIFNFGSLNLTDSQVTSNSSTGGGGGIYNNIAATLNVFDSAISANTTEGDGAGIYNASNANVLYSTLSSNAAEGNGGVMDD